MQETYLCPECGVEHAEPLEAVLGHRARCLTCVVLFEQRAREAELAAMSLEIRIAA